MNTDSQDTKHKELTSECWVAKSIKARYSQIVEWLSG